MTSRNAAVLTGAVDVGANVVASIVAARALGPVGSAPLALGLSVAGLLSVLTFLGAGEIATTLFAQGSVDRRRLFGAARAIAWRGNVRVVVGAVLAMAVTGFDPVNVACIALSVAALAAAGHGSVGQHVIWALEDAAGDLRDVVVTRAGFVLLVAALVSGGFGAIACSAAYLVQALVLAGLRQSRARRLIASHPGGTESIDADELARRGRPLGVAVVLGTLAGRLDGLLVARFAAPELGLFAAAQRLTSAGQTAAHAVAAALLPGLARDASERRPLDARRVSLVLGMGFAAGLVMVFAASPLVSIVYGPAFSDAVPMVRWFGAAFGFQWAWAFASRVLVAAGGATDFPRLQVLNVAVQLVAKPLLLWSFGATGAAAALVLSEGALAIAGTRALRRRLPDPFHTSRPSDPALVTDA